MYINIHEDANKISDLMLLYVNLNLYLIMHTVSRLDLYLIILVVHVGHNQWDFSKH